MPSVTYYQKPVEVPVQSNFEPIKGIYEAFGDNAELMLEVAKAESGMKAKAYNPEFHKGCQGSYGLFQIACVNYDGDPEDLFDPEINIKLAKKVYDSQGIKAWGVCTNGKVDCGV